MSRSYRKPCFRDNNRGGSKKAKTAAHRKLRRSQIFECGQNSNYKKYYCQYDINDYKYVVWRLWKHCNWCAKCIPGDFEETRRIWENDVKKAKRK